MFAANVKRASYQLNNFYENGDLGNLSDTQPTALLLNPLITLSFSGKYGSFNKSLIECNSSIGLVMFEKPEQFIRELWHTRSNRAVQEVRVFVNRE